MSVIRGRNKENWWFGNDNPINRNFHSLKTLFFQLSVFRAIFNCQNRFPSSQDSKAKKGKDKETTKTRPNSIIRWTEGNKNIWWVAFGQSMKEIYIWWSISFVKFAFFLSSGVSTWSWYLLKVDIFRCFKFHPYVLQGDIYVDV